MIGDSFGAPFSKENFPLADRFSFIKLNHFQSFDNSIKIDTHAYNALIIECAEKQILVRFQQNTYKNFRFPVKIASQGDTGSFVNSSEKPMAFWDLFSAFFGRKAITEQNLNILFFSNPLAIFLNETKAELNLKAFGILSDEVAEYKAKNILVQKSTTELKDLYTSSFHLRTETELKEIQKGIENLQDYYRQRDFDTVLLALIPNPISIVDPNYKGRTYNQLLPSVEARIQKAGIISVFDTFRNSSELLYRRGDTHWNAKGQKIWQDLVNREVEALVGKLKKNTDALQ